MIPVAVLGATGTVGQKFIMLLENHPQFIVQELVASHKSAGKLYHEACSWKQPICIPNRIATMKVQSLTDTLSSPVLFSGLDSSVAYEAEKHYAKTRKLVISNARNHRMEPHVPLLVPEINHNHIHAIAQQPYAGGIITNPNCSTIGLALALAPLHKAFGIARVMVTTMQAISGAGYPGVPSLDIVGNVFPYISGEEEKLQTEPQKILGDYELSSGFMHASFAISAHCNRVAVIDGHTECVSISFKTPPKNENAIKAVWNTFSGFPQEKQLHTAPQHPILYHEQKERPQPLLDILHGNGMTVSIGRLRPCSVLDYKFVVLSHNTIRGAAGSAILNAETALAMNVLQKYL